MPVDMSIPNSILSSYFAGRQMRMKQEDAEREAEMQKEQIAQMKINQQLAQQQDKRAEQYFNLYQKHQEAEMARQQARLELERTEKNLSAQQQLAQMVVGGMVKPQQQQIASPVPQNYSPIQQPAPITRQLPTVKIGNQEFDISQFPTPEEFHQQGLKQRRELGGVEAEVAGKKAKEVAQAELEPKKSFESFKTAEQLRLMKQEQKDNLERISKTTEGQRAIHAMDNAAAMDRARLTHFTGLKPEQASNELFAIASGQYGRKLGNNASDRYKSTILADMDFQEPNEKTKTELRNTHSLDVLYKEMENFINKLPEGAVRANIDDYFLSHKILKNEYANFRAKIEGLSGNVARLIGGERGVLTEKDIKRAVGLLIQPGITKAMALDRFKTLKAQHSSRVLDGVLGGFSNKQRLLLVRAFNYDPQDVNIDVDFKGKKVPLFRKDDDGEWLYADTKKGGYVSLDAGK